MDVACGMWHCRMTGGWGWWSPVVISIICNLQFQWLVVAATGIWHYCDLRHGTCDMMCVPAGTDEHPVLLGPGCAAGDKKGCCGKNPCPCKANPSTRDAGRGTRTRTRTQTTSRKQKQGPGTRTSCVISDQRPEEGSQGPQVAGHRSPPGSRGELGPAGCGPGGGA
jgi:hypothetical protein